MVRLLSIPAEFRHQYGENVLREIQDLLKKGGVMSLRELALHFSMKPEAIEPMLRLLVEKKRVRLLELGCGAGCAGCECMSKADAMRYELIE